MKKLFLVLGLLLLTLNVNAIEVINLEINIDMDETGYAVITENYNLQFISPFEKNDFNVEAIANSSSVSAWQADYEFFLAHFAKNAESINSSSITYDNEAQRLTFEYKLKEPLANLIEQEQRSDLFEINDREFFAFNESGTIAIPSNTEIRINFPSNTQINGDELPAKAVITGNSILLTEIQSNSLNISYTILKPIAPTVLKLFEGISNIYVILGPILVLVLLVVVIRRKSIEKTIEDYLVDHSEIKSRAPKEEIDFDLD